MMLVTVINASWNRKHLTVGLYFLALPIIVDCKVFCVFLPFSCRWVGYCTASPQRFGGQLRRQYCHLSSLLRSPLTVTCLPSPSAWKSRRMMARVLSGETYIVLIMYFSVESMKSTFMMLTNWCELWKCVETLNLVLYPTRYLTTRSFFFPLQLERTGFGRTLRLTVTFM